MWHAVADLAINGVYYKTLGGGHVGGSINEIVECQRSGIERYAYRMLNWRRVKPIRTGAWRDNARDTVYDIPLPGGAVESRLGLRFYGTVTSTVTVLPR